MVLNERHGSSFFDSGHRAPKMALAMGWCSWAMDWFREVTEGLSVYYGENMGCGTALLAGVYPLRVLEWFQERLGLGREAGAISLLSKGTYLPLLALEMSRFLCITWSFHYCFLERDPLESRRPTLQKLSTYIPRSASDGVRKSHPQLQHPAPQLLSFVTHTRPQKVRRQLKQNAVQWQADSKSGTVQPS